MYKSSKVSIGIYIVYRYKYKPIAGGTYMKTFHTIVQEYLEGDSGLRFGQYFCNTYIKKSWPELYYAKYSHARPIIQRWLRDNGYVSTMPPVIAKDS